MSEHNVTRQPYQKVENKIENRAEEKPENKVEKFVVRLPKGMRSHIADISRRSHRSMNSEIIARLEESLSLADPVITTESMITDSQQPLTRQAANQPLTRRHTTHIHTGVTHPYGHPEKILLQRIRQLPEKKREALLKLLE